MKTDKTKTKIKKVELTTSVEEVGLSWRLVKILLAADIKTVGDIISHDKLFYLRLKNFGIVCSRELDEFVLSRGMAYGPWRNGK